MEGGCIYMYIFEGNMPKSGKGLKTLQGKRILNRQKNHWYKYSVHISNQMIELECKKHYSFYDQHNLLLNFTDSALLSLFILNSSQQNFLGRGEKLRFLFLLHKCQYNMYHIGLYFSELIIHCLIFSIFSLYALFHLPLHFFISGHLFHRQNYSAIYAYKNC